MPQLATALAQPTTEPNSEVAAFMRPDEAFNLQHRDVEIVNDEATGESILVIKVRGKRGIGYCKSTANAVRPYERILKRPNPLIDDTACGVLSLSFNSKLCIVRLLPLSFRKSK
jgi:hypothetical protein